MPGHTLFDCFKSRRFVLWLLRELNQKNSSTMCLPKQHSKTKIYREPNRFPKNLACTLTNVSLPKHWPHLTESKIFRKSPCELEANFHFLSPRLFSIGGPSGRLATTDVIQISTTRARNIHWTSCSNSWTYYFVLNSLDIRNKNNHNEANKKGSGEVIWPHSHYTFIEYITSLV